jgi:hypothetical protein
MPDGIGCAILIECRNPKKGSWKLIQTSSAPIKNPPRRNSVNTKGDTDAGIQKKSLRRTVSGVKRTVTGCASIIVSIDWNTLN